MTTSAAEKVYTLAYVYRPSSPIAVQLSIHVHGCPKRPVTKAPTQYGPTATLHTVGTYLERAVQLAVEAEDKGVRHINLSCLQCGGLPGFREYRAELRRAAREASV